MIATLKQAALAAKALELAHRIAWRYKKSSDPAHSDTFTFNESTLLQFVDALAQQAVPASVSDAMHRAAMVYLAKARIPVPSAIVQGALQAALAAAPQTGRQAVPHPGSPEASAMIDAELAAYNWPSNAKNAARAGYVACMKLKAEAAPQAEQQATQAPAPAHAEFTDTARAALLWVLWHHQGGSSPVGQPIRFALGMGAHEHLNEHQIGEAKRWAGITGWTTERVQKYHPGTAAPADQSPAVVDGPTVEEQRELLKRLRYYGDNDRDAACALIERLGADLYAAEGRANSLARKLAEAQGCISGWVEFGGNVTDALGLRVMYPKQILAEIERLRAGAGPLPQAVKGEDARDAARYRWLRDVGDNGKTWKAFVHRGIGNNPPECIDEAIDAAMCALNPPVQGRQP
jgi:hypothetical protein